MRSRRAALLALLGPLGAWLLAGSALAHPSPAEPPAFFRGDCIVVVDKQQQASWHLDYAVLADDTAPELDHISLDDSKTHQFFALAGTLLDRTTGHVFLPFDDETGAVKVMPTWLSAQDVTRAAAGVKPEDMTSFTAEQVGAEDVLENDPALARAVRPLVAGISRVPITAAQGLLGVEWHLADVAPGAYQLAAYIFSPPYNGWAVRRGLVQVIDGADDADAPVAVTLEPVASRLFAGQGKRVRGCVDAPAGSTLELSTRAEAAVPTAFEPKVTQAVSHGAFELCLMNEGLDAVLELRVEVRTPDGRLAATQSSGAISFFSNAAACVASEDLCCPVSLVEDAGVPLNESPVPMVPVPMMPVMPGSVVDASAAEAGAGAPRQGGSSEQPAFSTEPASDQASAPSCQCRVGQPGSHPALLIGGVLLAIGWRRARAPTRAA